MADRDRYSSDDNRDRLGQRDVYMDNRTGIGGSSGGYRAEWGRGRNEERGRPGDREQNYNQRRGENASFGESDYGQSDGGRTGYRGRDDESRYGAPYGQGGRAGRNDENYGGGRYRQSGSRYSAGDQQDQGWMSYPARSNPDFYADETGSAGAGWTEDFDRGGRDRSLESYRGQNRGDYRDRGRWGGGEAAYGGGTMRNRSYEADYGERERHRGGEERGFWDRAADKVAEWFGGEDYRGSPYASAPSHRGKGPKNYRRSDDRIREDVSDKLADDHWLDASDIEVTVSTCEVTLTGTVRSRDDKRRAEQLAEQVSGVDHVQNNLRVQQQAWQAGQSEGAMGSAGSNTATGSSLGGGQSTGGSMSGASASGTTSSGSTTIGSDTTTGRSGKTTQ
jgi:osmotically-inducible protein OsmY